MRYEGRYGWYVKWKFKIQRYFMLVPLDRRSAIDNHAFSQNYAIPRYKIRLRKRRGLGGLIVSETRTARFYQEAPCIGYNDHA